MTGPTSSSCGSASPPPERRAPGGAVRDWPLALLPAAKLLLHLATIPGYGYFRDEFYSIACSERLAFGYVDHPPLSILLLRVVRELLGDSIWALRLVPALAGAATVLLVGLLARALGGGRLAQSLAMLAAVAAPLYLSLHHFYSMNAFDPLVWAIVSYLVVRLVKEDRPRLWLPVGAALGLGLQNKISVLWLGFGLAAGLAATSRRRDLLTPWPWAAAGIAILLFLPHAIWQAANKWPTLEFIRNATQEKMVQVSVWSFLVRQLRVMNPELPRSGSPASCGSTRARGRAPWLCWAGRTWRCSSCWRWAAAAGPDTSRPRTPGCSRRGRWPSSGPTTDSHRRCGGPPPLPRQSSSRPEGR